MDASESIRSGVQIVTDEIEFSESYVSNLSPCGFYCNLPLRCDVQVVEIPRPHSDPIRGRIVTFESWRAMMVVQEQEAKQ